MRWSWLSVWLAIPVCATIVGAQETYPLSIPTPKDSPAPLYSQHTVLARDDAKLVVHEWVAPKPAVHKTVILFIHGIGMHGAPYASIAAGFTSHGLTFVVPDLRGHGRSEGKREELAAPHVLRADLAAVMTLMNERHPGASIVLAGESMGGLLAADYAWRGERRVAGLALLAPAFLIKPLLPDLGDLLHPGFISLDSEQRLKPSTADNGFIKARRADRLALPKVSLTSYLATLGILQAQWPLAATEIKLPILVCVGGKDQIVDSSATRRVFERIASAKQDKTWRQWDDACHTLCWDPVTPQLVEEVAQWALVIQRKTGR
jgi:acylglycerol lipase